MDLWWIPREKKMRKEKILIQDRPGQSLGSHFGKNELLWRTRRFSKNPKVVKKINKMNPRDTDESLELLVIFNLLQLQQKYNSLFLFPVLRILEFSFKRKTKMQLNAWICARSCTHIHAFLACSRFNERKKSPVQYFKLLGFPKRYRI